MADAGQMLSQLWANNPVNTYIQAAQLRASLDSIALRQQAQVFEQQLSFVKQQDDQAKTAANMVLQANELEVHRQNADTQRMFANNELSPNSLANQYKRAQIAHLLGINGADTTAANGFVNMLNGGSGGGGQVPTTPGGAPQSPSIDSFGPTQTAAAPGGGTGILPALPGAPQGQVPLAPGMAPSTVASDGQQVPLSPQTAAMVNADPTIQAATQEAKLAGLKMASAHEKQYGRSYQDTLAIDPTSDDSDNTPSQAEIESAQGIQKYSDGLNPAQPTGPAPQGQTPAMEKQLQAAAGQGQATNSAPQSPLVQEAKLKALVEAYKGAPAKLKSLPSAIQANVNNMAALAALKFDPAYQAAQAKAYPQTQTIDGKVYELKRWVGGENGMKNPEYVEKNGDGTLKTQTLTDEKGTPVQIMTTTPDGKQHFSALPKATAPIIPEAKNVIPDTTEKRLTEMAKQASQNPNDEAVKIAAFNAKYGADKFTKSPENWSKAYAAAADESKTALADLQKSLIALRKSGHVIDSKYLPFLPDVSDPTATPDPVAQTAPTAKASPSADAPFDASAYTVKKAAGLFGN